MIQWCSVVREDSLYRRKLCLTSAVLFSYILQGWSEQQVGVALSSLQSLVGVGKEDISLILVGWCVGYVIGSVTSGILFDKFNRLVLMFSLTLGLAVATAVLPFCPTLLWMIACNFMIGIFNGGSDTGSNTIIPTIWQDECGPFEQLLYVCYGVGGMISPFVTIPFMSESPDTTVLTHSTNITTNSTRHTLSETETDIYPAFLITSVMFVVCSIPYIIMRFSGKFNGLAGKHISDEEETDQDSSGPKHVYYKALIFCMGAIHALAVASEDNISTYLVSFTLEFLEWNDLDSATLMSSYWIASCCTGVLGIFIVKYVDYSTVLWIAVICVNCSLSTVVIGYFLAKSFLIWLGFISCASSMILIIPIVFSWSQKYACEITGKVSSIFTVSAGISSAASAYLIGFMFEKYSKMSFVYIILASMCICLIFYFVAHVLRFEHCKFHKSNGYSAKDTQGTEDDDDAVVFALMENKDSRI